MTRACLIAAVALLLGGCGSGDAETTSSSAQAPTTNSDGRTIASTPPASVPAGGIMMQPSDPNDPKFKADPKLNGGG